MARVWIDGKTYEVDGEQNLLHACLSLKLDLPYFCWHPALGSVGACRQCAVKVFRDEGDRAGRIVMACMTPAREGTRLSIEDPEARAFRAAVLEWMMLNHPHDCPVCDEGGECHLQDMTVLTGHVVRRHRFRKRTYRNQNLGPFIHHEMNRCIQCYRCVRFYRDYAGGRDLDVFGFHDRVYFGRAEDGTLESEFSGNLVEVCPTGVFTDKTFRRHYTRKWDLQSAPSVCAHCSVGCNTSIAERYGVLRRVVNRYHSEVNGYFLCDRGRFGYECVNDPARIRHPLWRPARGRPPEGTSRERVLARLASGVGPERKVIGIGSPRASLEANFALRALVGADRFFAGVSGVEARLAARVVEILRRGPARPASLRDVERADAVLVLGEDVCNTAPRAALAVRQAAARKPREDAARALGIPLWDDGAGRAAVQDRRGPLFVATPGPTRLDDAALRVFRAAPDDLARLGAAVARALGAAIPEPPDLPPEAAALAGEIAGALSRAARPAVVSGTGLLHEGILRAAAAVAGALAGRGAAASIALFLGECNSMGLAMLEARGLPEAARAAREEGVDTIIVLENDLYRRMPAEEVDALLGRAELVVAIDALPTATTERADAVLPAATFAEGNGTFVSAEGRAQRFFQAFVPEGDVQESWRWLRDLARAAGAGGPARWERLDDVTAALAAAVPGLARVTECAPPASFRILDQKIPRQTPRASGRTAVAAHRTIREPRPPDDPDTPLAFSMEGYGGPAPPSLLAYVWAPGWNSDQAIHKFQSRADGPLAGGDPGVRLLEPGPAAGAPERVDVGPAFRPSAGRWLFVPTAHVFGSEELSARSPAVRERIPRAGVVLGARDAAGLRAAPGEPLEVRLPGFSGRLPLEVRPEWPEGVAGFPAGFPGIPAADLPAWGTIRRPS